jgi:hypothetical protein
LMVRTPPVETVKQIPEIDEPGIIDPKVNGSRSQEQPAVQGKHSPYHAIKGRRAEPMTTSQEPPLFSQVNRWVELGSPHEVAITQRDVKDDSPEMLRIEIQTADPNIRIIWFTPKVADSPQTNP